MCTASASKSDAWGAVILFLALASTLASCGVAQAHSPAEGPNSQELLSTPPQFRELRETEMQLQVEQVEQFTDLWINIFPFQFFPGSTFNCQ
jgi:hypothetical protein